MNGEAPPACRYCGSEQRVQGVYAFCNCGRVVTTPWTYVSSGTPTPKPPQRVGVTFRDTLDDGDVIHCGQCSWTHVVKDRAWKCYQRDFIDRFEMNPLDPVRVAVRTPAYYDRLKRASRADRRAGVTDEDDRGT